MGFSIGSQVYQGGATYLDSGGSGCDIGYTNMSTGRPLKTKIDGYDVTNAISLHEIVKPGFYRIGLQPLRIAFNKTCNHIMEDTFLTYTARVLINVPDGYLVKSNNSDNLKKYLGRLAKTQLYPNANMSENDLCKLYLGIGGMKIPYFKPEYLAKCYFTTKYGSHVASKIDSSWAISDLSDINGMQVPDENSGVLHDIDFYEISTDKNISFYIEGYGFSLVPSGNIIFLGEKYNDSDPKKIIYKALVYDTLSPIPKSSANSSWLPSDRGWGYNFPFAKNLDASLNMRIAWPTQEPYSVGDNSSDKLIELTLPYNPDIFTAVGELPATNKAYVPLTFNMNNAGIPARTTSDSIGINGTSTYLPLGYYKFDHSDYTKFNYTNLAHSGYTYLYGFEVFSNAGSSSIIQKVYESYGGVVYRIRTGGTYGTSNITWKGWTYFGC